MSLSKKNLRRDACIWPGADPLMRAYHDAEWGTPAHDDRAHFEALVLDTNQSGLSWQIILHKRENFRRAFDGFDYRKVAAYGAKEIRRLMADKGIVRNRLKVLASISNAKALLAVHGEFGSFDSYVWKFVGGKTTVNKPVRSSHIAATSKEAAAMSADMKRRGFKFCGPTVCYAYMQGVGMVDDHLVRCFRKKELAAARAQARRARS
jgi:DNA-3-methyladenine glycosylase I